MLQPDFNLEGIGKRAFDDGSVDGGCQKLNDDVRELHFEDTLRESCELMERWIRWILIEFTRCLDSGKLLKFEMQISAEVELLIYPHFLSRNSKLPTLLGGYQFSPFLNLLFPLWLR